MKGVVIYKGRYGATHEYAEWLGEELRLSVFDADEIREHELCLYDYFIIGSSVYIGKLQITSWLQKNADRLTDKKIFFFQVAGTPPSQTEKVKSYFVKGVPAQLRKEMDVFFLPGRLCIKKLSWWDKLMLTIGAKLVRAPEAKKVMTRDYDHVHKINIVAIFAAVRKFNPFHKPVKTYVTYR